MSDYRVILTGPRSSCGEDFELLSGAPGQLLTHALRPPTAAGWCRGRYRGLVLLERGPYCPKPVAGQPPRPCPLFASQALDVGRFSFRVR